MPAREFHPKCYLRYLCDPTLTDKRKRYRETDQGVAVLRSLDWSMCWVRHLTARFSMPSWMTLGQH